MPHSAAQWLPLPNRRYTIHGDLVARLLPHRGPNAPAAGYLNSVGWLSRSLDACLARSCCPIIGSLNSVGRSSRSLAGCQTLQLGGYRCPIVGIPFTAILSHAVHLLHLCPECPPNVVQNYRPYPVWTIGPHLDLPGKKVFSVSDYVSVLENTRWVQVLADLILRQA